MPQRAAAAEVETGKTLVMMSGYEQAMKAYHRALALGGDAAQPGCAALTGLAWTEANMGRSADALRDASTALKDCAPLKEADPQAYERAMEAEGEAEFWVRTSGEGDSDPNSGTATCGCGRRRRRGSVERYVVGR